MITFKSLRWKNFLSTGENWSEVDLTAAKQTLVVGHNGAGKSTMLDALSFALFGRAHRNISKTQLVNSINKKGTVVEAVFNVKGSEYKVVRGIKPNNFEIWKDGMMLNQSSHAKEYQKILEQNILKLNHKSFHQIVVLGSSSFIPFMQLSAQNRRDVIEDLLDMNVFSKMNALLKEKISQVKGSIKDVTHKHDVTTTKIDASKRYIKDIKAINKEQKEEKLQLIADFQDEIKTLHGTNKELSDAIQSELPTADAQRGESEAEIKTFEAYRTRFSTEVKKVVKEVSFFEENDTCPTCTQPITEATKEEHIVASKARAKELQEGIVTADERVQAAQSTLSTQLEIVERCRSQQSEIAANNQSIAQFQSSIDRTQREIDKLSQSTDLDGAKTELETLTHTLDDLIYQKTSLNEQYNYNIVMSEMLKDTGIKTKIVKQYIPVINNLVNKYLATLDFFVSFNLDEYISETIRSRHRDDFSYDSFSEGEKQRIDLALLFTWRQIAKMKNSVATNLLILDETFD